MSKLKLKNFLLLFLLTELLFAYTPAFAQTPVPFDYGKDAGVSNQIKALLCAPPDTGASTNGVLYQCINQLYKFAIVLAVVIGVFFIVIAGYIYMSADGNTESVDKAKSIIESTIVSLVILLGGWLLLNAINPDLIQFHNVQPPTADLSGVGVGTVTPGTPVPDTYTKPNDAVKQLEGSGCVFQTGTQKNEAPQMVSRLVDIVKNICYNVTVLNKSQYPGTDRHPPTISSIIGMGPPLQHSANSYHYKGCAVDFADGGGQGFVNVDYNTGVLISGRPTGVAIYKEARANGISVDRIDPGTDRNSNKSNMLHIDLGTSCPNSANVNATGD